MEDNCCCCECAKELGCYAWCDCVDVGITADQDGIYTLVVGFNGQLRRIDATFKKGDQLLFPTKNLIGNYSYTGYVEDPLLKRVKIGFIAYDCVKFTIKL